MGNMGSNVNETLGTWSEWFMLLAALTYLVVFVAFVWDMSSHSKALGIAQQKAARKEARDREAGLSEVHSKELVGAGVGRGAGARGASGASWDQVSSEFRTSSTQEKTRGDVQFESLNYTKGSRRPAARAAVILMVIAFALHAFAVVSRGIAADRVPWANMYEFCTSGALLVSGVYLATLIFKDLRFVGPMVSGLVLTMLCAATIAFPTPVSPLQPALQSYWLIIHVSIAVAASGIFTITFAMAILQLLQHRREEQLARGETSKLGFLRAVPDSTTLENFSFRLNSVAFVFWTFTLAAGAIWADQAWGRFWGWDTKEVWTFVIWTVYAAYMHARVTRGWTGTRSAWLSIVGYLCIVFNFAVVNVFFSGLHSYSGL